MIQAEIVPMKIEHIDKVVEIERLCFAIPWSREAFFSEINNNSFAVYFVASVGDEIAGYGGFWKVCDEGHITNIAVRPEYQKQKIGSAILEEMIEYSRDNNVELMTLEVRAGNEAAKRLYSKFGFRKSSIRKEYYTDNNEDAIIMINENIQGV